MFITCDIGNTNIKLALYEKEKQIAFTRFLTKQENYKVLISNFIKAAGYTGIKDAIISCVVPSIQDEFINDLKKFIENEIIIIDYKYDLGIKPATASPQEIGADLLVLNAYAYKLVKGPFIAISFGTASVFTYTDADANFRYAVIAPGFEAGYKTLWQNTDALNSIKITKPKTILATNTYEAMNAGIVVGYIGLCTHIIDEMKKELNIAGLKVIASGGNGLILHDGIKNIDYFKADFITDGLAYLYMRNH